MNSGLILGTISTLKLHQRAINLRTIVNKVNQKTDTLDQFARLY